MSQHFRRAGGRLVSGADRIFHSDRQAGERPDGQALAAPLVDPLSRRQRPGGIHMENGIDRAIVRLDPLQKGLRALHGGEVALTDGGHDIDGCQFGWLHGAGGPGVEASEMSGKQRRNEGPIRPRPIHSTRPEPENTLRHAAAPIAAPQPS